MRKLSRFEKMGLIAAVVVAGTFFYMKRVYEPQEKVLKKTVEQLNKVIGEINAVRAVPPAVGVKQELARHKEELTELEEQLKETTNVTGKESEVTTLLGRIVKLLDAKSFAVKAIRPMGKAPDDLFQWSLFEIEMAGDFRRFMELLTALRDLRDAVRVEGIALARDEVRAIAIQMKLKI